MLNKELMAALFLQLFVDMRTQAESGNPMDDATYAQRMAEAIDQYTSGAGVLVDTFAANAGGFPVVGTATGRLL